VYLSFLNMLIIILNIHTQVGKVTKDTCGGATYKAGKSDALAIKEIIGNWFCILHLPARLPVESS
jgi:hypothetical protein